MPIINKTWKAYLAGGVIGIALVLFWAYFLLSPEISASQYIKAERMAQQSPRIASYVEKIMKDEGDIKVWQYLLMLTTAKEEKKQAVRKSVKDSVAKPE